MSQPPPPGPSLPSRRPARPGPPVRPNENQPFRPPSRAILWYMLATMLVLWAWQEGYQQMAVRIIPYSEFKRHLSDHTVKEAWVAQDQITGRISGSTTVTRPAPATPTASTPGTTPGRNGAAQPTQSRGEESY